MLSVKLILWIFTGVPTGGTAARKFKATFNVCCRRVRVILSAGIELNKIVLLLIVFSERI